MLDLKEVNFSGTLFDQDVVQKGLEQGFQQGLEQGLQRGEAVGGSLPEVIWFCDCFSGVVGHCRSIDIWR